jgi:BirA family biotin operon repressor/biotin-[acetyl-CoA-carboxylase] ligase
MKLIHLKVTDSTNDYVSRNAEQLTYPTLIIADYQSSGKGRLGRPWHSESRGFWGSYAWVWPKSMLQHLHFLSLVVGLQMHKALRQDLNDTTALFEVKWPNDLYLSGSKLGGILIETRPFNGHILVIVGAGVNYSASNHPDRIGYSQASLMDFESFRTTLIHLFDTFSLELLLQPDTLIAEINQVLAFRGQTVKLTHSERPSISGVLLGLDSLGFLMIGTQTGVQVIRTTDWSMRPLG